MVDAYDNDLSGNATGAINNYGSATGCRMARNRGYNPVGISSVTPGASPWTYTAGITSEVVYVSGGTVSGITKGGLSVPTSGSYVLEPAETIVVTYSSVPTVRADKK